jgi:manganese transport protein
MLIILLGINPMKALVLSQVTLSFVLPAAIIPMLLIARRKDLMGSLVNKPSTNVLGWIITSVIICLNVLLLVFTFTGKV